MLLNVFRPLFRQHRLLFSLSPHGPSFYNVFSVSSRRNFSVTIPIPPFGQGVQRPRVSSPINEFPGFIPYLDGHYTEPYGRRGKESRDLFIQTVTKTFKSVAEDQRLSHTDSSDTSKSINPAQFLFDVLIEVTKKLKQPMASFDRSVYVTYCRWITMFSSDHVLKLNDSWSGPNSLSSMLQNSTDSIEMFLEDYFRGNIDQTELEIRANQIVGDIILCMEEFLSCLVPEQAPEKKG